MSRVSVADNAKLSWLLLRGVVAARRRAAQRPSGAALAAAPAQIRPAPDRAAGPAHRRCHPRHRNLFRPLRLRRQGRGLRRPLDLRDGAAVRRMGDGAARLRLAAPSARRRIRHHPRQCARPGRRMDHAAGRLASDRLAAGRAVAAHHFLAQPGDAGVAGRRRAVLSPLPAQPGAPGALSAPYRARCAARRRPHAGRDRAHLCGALHRRPGAPHQVGDRAPASRARSGRSCPTAAMPAATPAPSSRFCWSCCRCARRSPRATSRRRRRCSTPSTA